MKTKRHIFPSFLSLALSTSFLCTATEIKPPKLQSTSSNRLFKRADLQTTQSPFMLAQAYAEKPSFALASSISLPISSHCLYSIADDDRSLELEDGSHWEVSDPYTLRTWRPGDVLTITPDYSWFTSYDYYITNKTTNTYVKADLYIGPIAFEASANWIVDIDYSGGHIYLQNGMVWCVNPKDQHLMKHWAINDHIILGLEGSFWPYYDHILINVNMDQHVRVKQY